MQAVIDFFVRVLNWLLEFVVWAFQSLWELLVNGLALVLNAIPVPEWLENAPSVLADIPTDMLFVLAAFKVAEGLAILVSAYTLRFVIRRLPVIG